jgi:SAM-dependent methyltransferase
VSFSGNNPPEILGPLRNWWKDQRSRKSVPRAARLLAALVWEFVRDSFPSRKKQRYGDAAFDWDFRVNTTSATVSWRERLLGLLHSSYQPTDPVFFHPMMQALDIDFREFTFIDIGSGKGRALLMASDYPFARIVGVELLPRLHEVALANIAAYKKPSQKCFRLESICRDAREFSFPPEPIVLYLFNPLPETALAGFIANLEKSLQEKPRPARVLYHNPVLGHILEQSKFLKRVSKGEFHSIYAAFAPAPIAPAR